MTVDMKKVRIPGLVLEGGAMRGMYTAGVLDTFMDYGLESDYVVGVSAGALFGVNYLSGQKGRAIRYNKRFNSDKTYMGLIPLLKEGNIVNTEYAYVRVPRELDPFDAETFNASKSEFYAVITNLKTGKGEYVLIKDAFPQMDVLRASGSMPVVSKPVEIDGNLYLDGAVADSIPYEWMYKKCRSKMVVILTRDSEYRKKPMPKFTSWVYQRKYPKFAQAFSLRHAVYNRQVEKLKKWEDEGKAFVIRPSEPITISRTERDSEKLQAVYELGIRDAKANMAKLKAFLEEK